MGSEVLVEMLSTRDLMNIHLFYFMDAFMRICSLSPRKG